MVGYNGKKAKPCVTYMKAVPHSVCLKSKCSGDSLHMD